MNRTTNYLRRGWQALQNDTHWIRTIVLMALASLVPIVGPIFVAGYCYMWAKEAAWGMDKPLPSNLDGMGERGKYGLYAAVIEIVWLVIFWVIRAFTENITWLWIVLTLIMIVVSVLASVAILRALIYDHFRPGFQVIRIFRMAAQDVSGLARCFGIGLLGACAIIVGMLLVYLVADFGVGGLLVEDAGIIDSALSSVPSIGVYTLTLFVCSVLIVALFLAMAFASTLFSALSIRAYGYWIGQFEPQNWGGPDTPMPFERDSVQYRQITVMDVRPAAEPEEQPAGQPADEALQDDATAAQPEEKAEPEGTSAADEKPEEATKPIGSKASRPAAKSGPASTEADDSDKDKSDTDDTGSKAKRSSTRKNSTAKKAAEKKTDADDKKADADEKKADADDKPAEADAAGDESEDTK